MPRYVILADDLIAGFNDLIKNKSFVLPDDVEVISKVAPKFAVAEGVGTRDASTATAWALGGVADRTSFHFLTGEKVFEGKAYDDVNEYAEKLIRENARPGVDPLVVKVLCAINKEGFEKRTNALMVTEAAQWAYAVGKPLQKILDEVYAVRDGQDPKAGPGGAAGVAP